MIKIAKARNRAARSAGARWRGTLAALLLIGANAPSFAGETALYWSISRDGEPVGYLLGTIHSEDPRVLDFPDRFIEQLNGNDIFAMELVPDLPTLSRLTDYMHYADGSTIESRIGASRFARLQAALAGY